MWAADPFRYFLTLTSFQPLYGKLSDIFGRKPCLLFSYSIFGLGCLFCGFARNLGELVGARAFAGECLNRKNYVKSNTNSMIPSRHRWGRYDRSRFYSV